MLHFRVVFSYFECWPEHLLAPLTCCCCALCRFVLHLNGIGLGELICIPPKSFFQNPDSCCGPWIMDATDCQGCIYILCGHGSTPDVPWDTFTTGQFSLLNETRKEEYFDLLDSYDHE